MAVLEVKEVVKKFGGVTALDNVSFSVKHNEFVALIGPNGSGKTTLFNCIAGELTPDQGTIIFKGVNVVGLPVNRIAKLGVSRSFQQIEVFPQLTVRNCLFLAGQESQDVGILEALLRTSNIRKLDVILNERVCEMMDLLNLTDQAEEYAGELSYGQRKILAIGMTLMSEPELLLLDEPVAAVNPTMISLILEILVKVRAQGHTILLVEHNLPVVMHIAERVIVLNSGKKLLEGSPDVIKKDARVIEAYFGG
jgi:branched-chain amino acid transport system ATP-binding protein